MIEYSTLTKKDFARLVEPGAGIIGARLEAVRYFYLPQIDSHEYEGSEAGVDSDLMAVELDFGSSGRRTITWATLGECEGLSLLEDDGYSDVANGSLDASSRPGWHEQIGQAVESVAASWQDSGDDCDDSVWALRFGFSSASVVVALGGANPEIDYFADELVAIFQADRAQRYRPSHVDTSAWGEPVQRR